MKSKNNILIAHPKTAEQMDALKAFMRALKIKFEIAKEDVYDPDFVEKILQGKKDIEQGRFTEVKQENLKSFIDGL